MSNRLKYQENYLKGESSIGEFEKVRPLYLTVGKEVTLHFAGTQKRLGRLVSINLSVNKIYELMNNGLADRESLLKIKRVSLITRSNFKTDVLIDTAETRSYSEGKDILSNGALPLFVDKTQHIKRKDLYMLSRKNIDSYEKERGE